MERIVIHQSIGWTAYEAKHTTSSPKPIAGEKIYSYRPGEILTVVPDLGPDDEYVEGTVPLSRAKGMCAHDFASEDTAEAMRAAMTRIEAKREKIIRAKAEMDANE